MLLRWQNCPSPQIQPGTVNDAWLFSRMYLVPRAHIPPSPLETSFLRYRRLRPFPNQVDRSRSQRACLPASPRAHCDDTIAYAFAPSLQLSGPALRSCQAAGRRLPTFKQCVHGGLHLGWAEKRVGLSALSQPFRGGGPGHGGAAGCRGCIQCRSGFWAGKHRAKEQPSREPPVAHSVPGAVNGPDSERGAAPTASYSATSL